MNQAVSDSERQRDWDVHKEPSFITCLKYFFHSCSVTGISVHTFLTLAQSNIIWGVLDW